MRWQDDAWQRMRHALDTAFGGLPPDLEAEPLVMRGNPGPVLVGAASRDGDRLVVGAGRRGTFGRLRHGRVSRYCLAHAGCPVIAVPSPALNRAAVRAARAHARVPDLTTAGLPSGALVPIPWLTTGGCHGRAAIRRGQRVGTSRAGVAGPRAPDRGRRDRRAADPDHFSAGAFGQQLAPFTALASAAAVTTRLRVGTIVLSNDFRHPAIVAHEAASLHLASGGRFELGLGAGWYQPEYDAAGIGFDPAGQRIGRSRSRSASSGPCSPAPRCTTPVPGTG